MPTPLYHVTHNTRNVMTDIDPGRLRHHDEGGAGFYVRPGDHALNTYAGGFRMNGHGFIYRTEVPELIDGSRGSDGRGRWIPMNQPIDRPMFDRVLSALREVGRGQPAGNPDALKADRLEEAWKAGAFKDKDFNYLVKNAGGGPQSAEIWKKAGIVGSYSSEAAVILDPRAVPPPIPHEYHSSDNADARTVGNLLNGLNKEPALPAGANRDVRIALAEAIVATEAKSPEAYAKLQSAQNMLKSSGVQLSSAYQQQFHQAELASARAVGMTVEEAERLHRAQEQVAQRPPRHEGEGIENYKERIYKWHDETHRGVPEADKKAFNHRLHDTLYRESIVYHMQRYDDPLGLRGDPKKIEKMVADAHHGTGDKATPALNNFEGEMGRYHSTPEYKESLKAGHVNGPHAAGQRGFATPGKMAGLAGLAVAATMVAGQAQAYAGEDGTQKASLRHYFRAAVNQILPIDALDKKRYAESAVSLVEKADPTMGVVSGAIRGGLRAAGVDVEPGAVEAAAKQNPAGVIQAKQKNDRIDREQKFLFDKDHPDQLGTLKVIDPQTGRNGDVAVMLRDPQQRRIVFDDIARQSNEAKTSDGKEMLTHIKSAAEQFIALEGRRKPIPGTINDGVPTVPSVARNVADLSPI